MRFKLAQDGIRFFLSDREVSNYSTDGNLTKDDNVITDNDMSFKLGSREDFTIKVNETVVNLNVYVNRENSFYKAEVVANGYTFDFNKISEITKYDLFRYIVRYFKKIGITVNAGS